MAFGIGPRMGGAMGAAANMAGQKFAGQPAQTQQFGNMGPDARTTMGMPPVGQQGTLQGMQAPQGMQGGIGPSNMQEFLKRMMMGGGGMQQPMQGGIMGGGMPQGLFGGQQLFNQG